MMSPHAEMTPEERSRALRREADEVLELIRLREHCAAIGEIVPTGSYFLDLMMYPDIDLYLPPTTPEALFGAAAKFARYDCVRTVDFNKGGPAELKDGLYLKPVVEKGDWGRPWKVDIWCLAESVVAEKQAELIEFKKRMTPEQRKLILNYKYHVLNEDRRTPMFSGVYIYRAVIDQGLREFDEISRFLRENGIKV